MQLYSGVFMGLLYWVFAFLLLAVVAAIFGFSGIAGTSAWIAQLLLIIFIILFIVSWAMGRERVL